MRSEACGAYFALTAFLCGCQHEATPARAEPPRPTQQADASAQPVELREAGATAPREPASSSVRVPNRALLGLYERRVRVQSWDAPRGFERATNCLLLLEHEGQTLFGLETYGLNSHGCVLAGRLVEEDTGAWLDVGHGCRIELEISRASIRLKRDLPMACSDEPCGASVSAVGAVFPRKLRRPAPAQRTELCGGLHDVLRAP